MTELRKISKHATGATRRFVDSMKNNKLHSERVFDTCSTCHRLRNVKLSNNIILRALILTSELCLKTTVRNLQITLASKVSLWLLEATQKSLQYLEWGSRSIARLICHTLTSREIHSEIYFSFLSNPDLQTIKHD